MGIKNFDEVFEELKKIMSETLPPEGVTGEDYEKWLCDECLKQIKKFE